MNNLEFFNIQLKQQKMLKKIISTSKWGEKHPFAGQNTLSYISIWIESKSIVWDSSVVFTGVWSSGIDRC